MHATTQVIPQSKVVKKYSLLGPKHCLLVITANYDKQWKINAVFSELRPGYYTVCYMYNIDSLLTQFTNVLPRSGLASIS